MIKHKANLENLHLFMEYALRFAEDSGLNKTDLARLELAIEESVVNIISYAFPGRKGEIEMSCESRKDSIVIELKDNGLPFNPLEKEDPDITASVEDRKVGGLGIYLVKNIMDEVSYKYHDGCNILTLLKRVSKGEESVI